MFKTYPFQALLALAGLGLIIGLPSLQRSQDATPLMSQARGGTCYADSVQTQNTTKATMHPEASLSVGVVSTSRTTLSNPVMSEKNLPSTKMRQNLRQCV